MSDAKQSIRKMLGHTGAVAVGFAAVSEVDDHCSEQYGQWLRGGHNASMHYMESHGPLRRDPRLLLPEAKTVICMAYPYNPPTLRNESLPYIARYAYGRDYHKVLRSLLKPVCRDLESQYGASSRICIDSAPVHERYWALRSGIGRRGDNGCVIVDSHGSFIFLAEIFTTLELEPDTPSTRRCRQCGACAKACPAGALLPDGTLDARKCLSYLTIEHTAPLTCGQRDLIDATGTLFGCDRCQLCCPHNADVPTTDIADFRPHDAILNITKLTAETIAGLPATPLRRALRTPTPEKNTHN